MKKLTLAFTLTFAFMFSTASLNQSDRTIMQKDNRIVIDNTYEFLQNIDYHIDIPILDSCTYTAHLTIKGHELVLSVTRETCEEAYNDIVRSMKQIWEETGMI